MGFEDINVIITADISSAQGSFLFMSRIVEGLVNQINKASQDFERFEAIANKTGASLEAITGLTSQQVQEAQALQRAWGEMETGFQRMRLRVLSPLASEFLTLNRNAQNFGSTIKALGNTVDVVLATIPQALSNAITSVLPNFAQFPGTTAPGSGVPFGLSGLFGTPLSKPVEAGVARSREKARENLEKQAVDTITAEIEALKVQRNDALQRASLTRSQSLDDLRERLEIDRGRAEETRDVRSRRALSGFFDRQSGIRGRQRRFAATQAASLADFDRNQQIERQEAFSIEVQLSGRLSRRRQAFLARQRGAADIEGASVAESFKQSSETFTDRTQNIAEDFKRANDRITSEFIRASERIGERFSSSVKESTKVYKTETAKLRQELQRVGERIAATRQQDVPETSVDSIRD